MMLRCSEVVGDCRAERRFNGNINMSLDHVYHRGPLPRLAVSLLHGFQNFEDGRRKSSKEFSLG
jgi:hypothetical protein